MSNTVSISNLRPELWQKSLYKDVIDGLYFSENNLMGKDDNNIVQIKDELQKSSGDTITLPLTAKLSESGITGDSELEGNEEAISSYSESIVIDQIRHAVRLTGLLDEQKNAYDMRSDAKAKLKIWLQEFIERQVFMKLAGVDETGVTALGGGTPYARSKWSNTPDTYTVSSSPGDRYICANSSGLGSLGSTDLITPALISKLRAKASISSPKVRPLRVGGQNYYVLFVHTYQAYDLKRNAEFTQARREADTRGSSNPIFTGALGIWDGVIIKEHEYVPSVDVSASSTDDLGSGTASSADFARALLCGRQAIGFAKCKSKNGWVEKTFDYKNKTGFATGLIGGIQKVMFNSKEYGVIAADTAVTDLS